MQEPPTRPHGNAPLWLEDIVARFVDQGERISVDQMDLWSLLDSLPVAVLVGTDRACTRIFGNTAAQVLLKVPGRRGNLSQSAPEDERPPFTVYDGSRKLPPEQLPMQSAAATGQPVRVSQCEIRFEDGQSIHIAGHTIPLRNLAGEVCGSIGAFIDVSPQKESIDRAELVAREMAHRMKNNIALVHSVAGMTIRPHLDEEVYAAFIGRLMSIARFQDLAHKGDWHAIDAKALCEQIVMGVGTGAADRIAISGEAIEVDSNVASSLGLLLHELTTNAWKYGALSSDEGSLTIEWESAARPEGRRITCRWTETGGPPVEAPSRRGFGTQLIQSISRSLPNGSVRKDFAREGLRATVSFGAR